MISIIPIEEDNEWDSIVKNFDSYDVVYLSQYAKAFQENGEGKPLLIYYKNGKTKAVNVIMRRDISKSDFFKDLLQPNEWFDISTPYGYGGFWIEGEEYESLEDEYEALCKNNGFVSEFVRFHLFSKYEDIFRGKVESYSNNIVRTLDLSIDEIFMDFRRSVRKNVKKANRSGLQIEIVENGRAIDKFLKIYYETMDRNDASSKFYFSEDFFRIINSMEGNYVYFFVLYEDKAISTELVAYGEENCYSFLGGTNSDYFNLRPNDFLKYEIIKWAKEKGLKRFILGGGYGEDDGIFRYKKTFAPNGVHKFYIGKRIFDKNKYSELVEIRDKESGFDDNTNFFPKYRIE